MLHRFRFPTLFGLVLALIAAGFALSQAGSETTSSASNGPRPVVRFATRSDTSAPLRDLPHLPPQAGGPLREVPKAKTLPNRAGSLGPSALDPVLQSSLGQASAPSTSTNFEGVNNR